MIQRVQSLFLFFSSILSLIILFYAPVLLNQEGQILILKNLRFPEFFINFCVTFFFFYFSV